MIIFFNAYCAPAAEPVEGEEAKPEVKDFKTLIEIHNTTKLESGSQTSYEDIIFQLLEKVFDLKEEDLEDNLPKFFNELIKSGTIPKGAWNTGVSRFI